MSAVFLFRPPPEMLNGNGRMELSSKSSFILSLALPVSCYVNDCKYIKLPLLIFNYT